MYTQQRWLCCKQREGGQNYISWRTSEPFKEVVVGVFFFFFFFLLVQNYVAWTCYGVEKNCFKDSREEFLVCISFMLCVDTVLLLLFCRRCVRDTRQTRTFWRRGKAPFEAGLSNLSNPILSRSPHKTSIAYIRVISTLIQLEHI